MQEGVGVFSLKRFFSGPTDGFGVWSFCGSSSGL